MIYIASKTVHAPRWRKLREEGWPINSTWIDEAGQGESKSLADLWQRCIQEVRSARCLIAYREPNEVLKGGLVEIGAALAARKDVFLVGFIEPNFSFKHHPFCQNVYSIGDALVMAKRVLT